jgi:hypothetical protein
MAFRTIDCRVWFDWDINGTYVNESANLVRCSGESRLAPPESFISSSSGIVDRVDVELRNVSRRYSIFNDGGAAYHVPMYIETTINGGASWQRVFTGLAQTPKELSRTYKDMATIVIECRSRDELLRQARTSTSQVEFSNRVTAGDTEADVIRKYLQNSGLVETADFVLDKGMHVIQYAWLDDESPLEDMWKLAAACGGRLYCGKDGKYYYENMAHWSRAPHTVVQAAYDNSKWKRVEIWYEDDELYNIVTVEYSSRQIEDSAIVWEPDEVIQVPANNTRAITATFNSPIYGAPILVYNAATSGGLDMNSYVSVSTTWYAQRADILITNTHPTRAATVFPLEISGSVASGGPTADETRKSNLHGTNGSFFLTRGSRTRSLRGSVYVQSKAQASMLAQFLLDRHEYPRLFYRVSGVLGDGARYLGDRISITEPSILSGTAEAIITSLRWKYEAKTYTMDFEAVDAENLYRYATTSPKYFVIGGAGVGNQLGAAHVNRGRLFY